MVWNLLKDRNIKQRGKKKEFIFIIWVLLLLSFSLEKFQMWFFIWKVTIMVWCIKKNVVAYLGIIRNFTFQANKKILTMTCHDV